MSTETPKKKSAREVIECKYFALLNATSLKDDFNRGGMDLSYSYGANHLILGWRREAFREATKALHEARPKVSEKTIGKLLSASVVKLFRQCNVREDADPEADAPILESILPTLDPATVKAEVTDLLDRLKTNIRGWTVFVFLEGIELLGLTELPLGAAKLYAKDHGPLPQIIEDDARKGHPTPQDVMKFAGHCRSYLTVDIEGEGEYAIQWASDRAKDVVSILNLYCVSSRDRVSLYRNIAILGEPTITHHRFWIQCTPPVGEDPSSTSYTKSETAPVRYYAIGAEELQRWKDCGLDKSLESISFSETPLSPVQNRIRNAFTWYARAMCAYTTDERFVALMVALENLLVGNKEEVNLTQRIADEVAGLLGTNFESRESIKERAKALYKLRGHVVHHGVSVSDGDLSKLGEMVANTIVAFLRREMPVP